MPRLAPLAAAAGLLLTASTADAQFRPFQGLRNRFAGDPQVVRPGFFGGTVSARTPTNPYQAPAFAGNFERRIRIVNPYNDQFYNRYYAGGNGRYPGGERWLGSNWQGGPAVTRQAYADAGQYARRANWGAAVSPTRRIGSAGITPAPRSSAPRAPSTALLMSQIAAQASRTTQQTNNALYRSRYSVGGGGGGGARPGSGPRAVVNENAR